MKNVVNILIADDHVIVRNGLRFMLENQENFIPVIKEATNGMEVLDLVLKQDFDILLLDVQMPKMDGITTISNLREKNYTVPILVLSVMNDETIIRQVIENGCDGFILKDSGSEELIQAIETILGGAPYFGNSISQILLGHTREKNTQLGLKSELTKREYQVLQLIAMERTNDEIADELKISRRTVEGHKKKLTTKLNVRSSVGLVKYAINNGVI
ncbi:MAG: DNA-binding NarL/FixJ family response regulator [Crocinitomicaceae bacterium]|jgi:DNA-binding NarL/FixJ family response regulator